MNEDGAVPYLCENWSHRYIRPTAYAFKWPSKKALQRRVLKYILGEDLSWLATFEKTPLSVYLIVISRQCLPDEDFLQSVGRFWKTNISVCLNGRRYCRLVYHLVQYCSLVSVSTWCLRGENSMFRELERLKKYWYRTTLQFLTYI